MTTGNPDRVFVSLQNLNALLAPALLARHSRAQDSRVRRVGWVAAGRQVRSVQRLKSMSSLATNIPAQEGLAGDSAPPASLGYPLPFAVTGARARHGCCHRR